MVIWICPTYEVTPHSNATSRKRSHYDSSCALITRDSHPRFDAYHDKAFPLFLPYDNGFLELWLGGEREDHPIIAALLDQPKLFPSLEVQEVKSFKQGKPIGMPAFLEADNPYTQSPSYSIGKQ